MRINILAVSALAATFATAVSAQSQKSGMDSLSDIGQQVQQQRLPLGQAPTTESSIDKYHQVSCTRQARLVVRALDKGKNEEALGAFSPESKKLVTSERLGEMWASLEKQFGKHLSTGYGTAGNADKKGYYLAGIPVKYESADLMANALCDSKNNIVDFKFTQNLKETASTSN